MRLYIICPVRSVLLLAVLAGGLSGCGDYGIRLPGGYSLDRIYAGAVLISHPEKGIVITAHIDRYTVRDKLVIGHVSPAELPPESDYSRPGFFLLNTETHEVKQGLDKQTWLDSLREVGITHEPNLIKPSRFAAWLKPG